MVSRTTMDIVRLKSPPSSKIQDQRPHHSIYTSMTAASPKQEKQKDQSPQRTTSPNQTRSPQRNPLPISEARRRDSANRRASFESVREGGPTQSFIVSTQHQEGEIPQFDGTTDDGRGLRRVMTTSALLPSPALRVWKTDLRPLSVSKSTFDLKVDEIIDDADDEIRLGPPATRAGTNHIIGNLPYEVLDQILGYLLLDIPPTSSFAPRNADLLSCLLTCKELHTATLNVLYRHVTIPHSRIFAKMFNVISKYPSMGSLVRRLDFSHYTVIGLGRTRKANTEIQYLTSRSLAQCLRLMPNLREFLVHEHIDDILDEEVLKILFSMPSLRAVDLCACSSSGFVRSFDTAITNNLDLPQLLPNLRRLALHECSTLQAPVFERLLSRLPNLTHLEVAHTLITNKALMSIPETASLTHLNLNKCTRLTGETVVDFIINHPAAKKLQYLGVMSDAARHQILDTEDLERLLPALPSTLRSLNINGSNLTSEQFPLLLQLRSQLDELSIAQSDLSLSDLNSIFRPPPGSADLPTNYAQPSSLIYLDLTSVPGLTRSAIFDPSNLLLTHYSLPLSVIEISDEHLLSGLRGRYSKAGNGLGWIVKESGRRAWLVRERDHWNGMDMTDADGASYIPMRVMEDEESEDSAFREWKWGAKWWGMRKIPVARQDVGGMFGHYMYKA